MSNTALTPWWRPPTSEIPAKPGVYRFLDAEGRVIYVGKAKSLRARIVNYFQDPEQMHPRTVQMVNLARSVQWTIVGSEIEALTLEFQWINQLKPRYNVIFRDDKSYPYLSVSMGEKYPRVAISRDARRPGTKYFGPYTHVWAIRETIDNLLNTFPVRTCSPGVLRRAEAQGRPCLLGYIDRCSAPCVGRISEADHRKLAEELCAFMEGKTAPVERQLQEQMREAAEEQDYELAARKRDQLRALEKVQERNTMVLPVETDADIYALTGDELDVAVHVFYVRGGRVRGTRGWVIERVDERSESELMRDLLEQTYMERMGPQARKGRRQSPVSVDDVVHTPLEAMPATVLVSHMPAEREFLQRWLGQMRGGPVRIQVPRRGSKAELLETVSENARHALQVYKTRRAGDLTQRAVALEELQDALDLASAPLRIECFDVSHTGGQNRVASMVVFEDGTPRKDAYRTYNIASADEGGPADDTAALNEVLRRRFSRMRDSEYAELPGGPSERELLHSSGQVDAAELPELASGPIDPDTGRPRRFAYRPDLLVVDGGLAQVNAAQAALEEGGIGIPVVGLAKRLEEIWVPGESFPVIMPRSSAGLYLLQHLRDESHRFAIRKHRGRRSKAQTRSALDAVPGLGPARQKALLKHFGSVKKIREADVQKLAEVPGIGPGLATTIFESLNEQAETGRSKTKPD